MILFVSGCSKDQSGQKVSEVHQSSQPLKHLDPYSAPLHPSAKITEATAFEITLLDGESFHLQQQKGKVVLMNIWATWCSPCLDETPDLVELYNTYKDDGFVVLGVSTDEQGESVVLPFIEKYNVTYPIYIDQQHIVMDKYGPTMGIPTSYIIDVNGNLRYFAVGALTKKELEPRIKELLNEET